jgi:hypothetical protein
MFTTAVLLTAACSDSIQPTGPDTTQTANLAAVPASPKAADEQTFEVTIRNLTSGQPLTPPLAATHSRAADFFTVGRAASYGIKEISENGNLTPMLDALGENSHVSDVVVAIAGDPPPILPGGQVTFQIDASPGARFFSFASMLICTNDGFTGVDAVRLPRRVGDELQWYSSAYDAGTEINTEDFADLVPPCPPLTGVVSTDPGTGMSDSGLAEGGVIHHHQGVQGGDDLQVGVHGWSDPVAMISIKRLN